LKEFAILISLMKDEYPVWRAVTMRHLYHVAVSAFSGSSMCDPPTVSPSSLVVREKHQGRTGDDTATEPALSFRIALMRLLTLETILVATDLTETSAGAIVTGTRLADTAGATLHVAHVAPGEAGLSSAANDRAEYDREIEKAVYPLGTTRPQRHLMFGESDRAISSLAAKIKADVVVLGRRTQAHGETSDRPVGSTAYAFIAHTLVPVLVVVEPLSIPMRHALVAVDASQAARGSLLVAVSWSSALQGRGPTKARLTVLHVDTGADPTEQSAQMRRSVDHDADVLQRNAAGWAGVTVERATVKDSDPAAAISRHAAASGAELVILGTRASAEHRSSMWGSVSAAVTRQVSIPVLLVPPAVWRDHVRDIDAF
jgi:nucleotide-binding universal stress UspA family protein